MDDDTGQPDQLVRFTQSALLDLAGIDNATSVMWGIEQAERYLSFLDEVFKVLVRDPKLGMRVEQHKGYRSYTAKYKRRRSTHGHRIFYRETEYGILVVRILHTAMNWPDHL